MGLDRFQKTPCGFCFVEYYTHQDALDCLKYVGGTKLDERIIRTDLDPGFQEGRQYGYIINSPLAWNENVANHILDAENRVVKCATSIAKNSTRDVVDMAGPLKSSACAKKKNTEEEGEKFRDFVYYVTGRFMRRIHSVLYSQSVIHMLNTLLYELKKERKKKNSWRHLVIFFIIIELLVFVFVPRLLVLGATTTGVF